MKLWPWGRKKPPEWAGAAGDRAPLVDALTLEYAAVVRSGCQGDLCRFGSGCGREPY